MNDTIGWTITANLEEIAKIADRIAQSARRMLRKTGRDSDAPDPEAVDSDATNGGNATLLGMFYRNMDSLAFGRHRGEQTLMKAAEALDFLAWGFERRTPHVADGIRKMLGFPKITPKQLAIAVADAKLSRKEMIALGRAAGRASRQIGSKRWRSLATATTAHS
jgi:hypothetical protein